jgi:hypothetical protein
MTLTTRRQKGSALTYNEMDDNFIFLANNSNLEAVLFLGNTANNDIILSGNLYSFSVTSNTGIFDTITANNINAPGGIVLQTVYKRVDTKSTFSFSTAGTTGSIITDLNTIITPKFASSRVLVNFSITYEVIHDTIFKLFRVVDGVSTEIGTNTTDANYWSGIWLPGYDADNASTARTNTFFYIDTPNTTLPVTYSLMIQSGGSTSGVFYLNRTIVSAGAADYEVGISQVILQELTA